MTVEFPPPRKQIRDRLVSGDRALGRVMAARVRSLRPRETLYRAGERHDQIYRLTSGWMARSSALPDGRQQLVAVLLPGDLLGLKAMLHDRQFESVACLARATVQALDYEHALDLMRTNPDVSLRLMWQLAEDERRLHNWVIALGRGSAVQRLAMLMLDLRGRLMQAGQVNRDSFQLPMTQEQMGDHLGLTVVHVNRTLKKLREEGVLSIARGAAQIHDVDALSAYAAPMQDIFERESKSFGGGATHASMLA